LSLRFNAFEVTLSGFAGGEYLPLPPSKGPPFPFPSAPPFGLPSAMSARAEWSSGSKTQDKLCSPSMGTPLLRQITLMDKGVLRKLRKLRIH